ncbi:N-acetylated-alpha-linked acidic dipeptidase-like protein 2 [Karstenula rhodostoma CBS 690.94]|uniref:N-acetylated-alpha-linked acidic dipeptidase-like protein 2 n=1 Tax=Karstenula rhodostoma CBS 690.94 TaxID=1392251 RepID=A0A9P4PMQ9_9PLEO|nr:N-acetylated-alpha-linked acidic dipeptidase-like protein 2 [Karstenula rhodostoma CBS 690.94]
MKLIHVLAAVTGVHACQKEITPRHPQRHSKRQSANATFPPALDPNEQIIVNSFDNTTISTWSYYYGHGAHLAGTNETIAQWTADRWAENGFTSRLEEYYVYLNYPVSHSLTLTYANGSTWEPSLEEAVLAADDTTSYPNRIPTFHGYSPTGNASAEYVYVGRGQQLDFERLKELGVELEGKIALAKYGGPFRGLKVKNAQDNKMIAVVTFTDPGDDGNITEANGYAAYPDGPARNPTSVQRGSVQFLSTYPGDPTTPGYASKKDSPRADTSENLPYIPSLPISWLEVQPILQALNGHGTSAEEVNRTKWVGAIPGADYSTGVGSGASLSLSNVMKENFTTIWDAIGIINGTNPDEVVILGNHRDAWIVGGASDPNSGSAVLVELSKAFGKLLQTGWKPTRTIILASWDAEEYGSIGSTEWVEEYIPWLKTAAVSYLNVDIAVSGPYPYTDATPDLHQLATSVMKKVIYPVPGSASQTLYDVWHNVSGEFGVLGAGSDFVPFVHTGGIASLDLGAGGGATDPIYHYHSNYDTYHWMSEFGDPGFHTHKAIGQYIALLAYHLSSDAVLPLEPADYVPEFESYLEDLNATIAEANATIDISALSSAISTFASAAHDFNALRAHAVLANDTALITVVNHKARDFSRGFVSQGGLAGREYYKNLLFAPGLDTGYAPVTFPGVTESVTFAKDFSAAQDWVGKTADAVLVAAGILKT